MTPHASASPNIAQRLSFKTAVKDVPELYHLSGAGFFDEFFYFFEEMGVMHRLLELDPKFSSMPTTIRFSAVILIYLTRIVAGLAFYWHIEPVFLHSQALMRLVGFNGREIMASRAAAPTRMPRASCSIQSDQCHDGRRWQNNPNGDILEILTNAPVDEPLSAYDRKSEMENSLFRKAKQAWFIEYPGIVDGP